jgi:hypothetical protein
MIKLRELFVGSKKHIDNYRYEWYDNISIEFDIHVHILYKVFYGIYIF